MKHDDLERAMQAEIAPSSDFVGGVMDAVRRESAVPPPIPFPWIRALPAFLAAIATIVIVCVKYSAGQAPTVPAGWWFSSTITRAAETASMYGLGWIVLALVLTALCLVLSLRAVTGSWRTL